MTRIANISISENKSLSDIIDAQLNAIAEKMKATGEIPFLIFSIPAEYKDNKLIVEETSRIGRFKSNVYSPLLEYRVLTGILTNAENQPTDFE